MRQIRNRLREKYPRSYKIISKSTDIAFHVSYWGMCTAALYVYMLQYSVTGCDGSIDK